MIRSIVQVGDVLLSPDCFEETFACQLSECGGACCVEGDAGAPVTMEETSRLRSILPTIMPFLSPAARRVIQARDISYIDPTGELAVNTVDGRDCIFAVRNGDGICLCAIDIAFRKGSISVPKPISCRLYPLRLKTFANGLVGVNVHHWDICRCAFALGRELRLPVYKFLREPLIARFGPEWYSELEDVAATLLAEHP